MSFSVLLLDNVDSVCKHVFEQRGIKAVQPGTLTLEELNACIGEYDGLVVRSATKVTPELLQHAPKLKVIGRAGVGVDNLSCNQGCFHISIPHHLAFHAMGNFLL